MKPLLVGDMPSRASNRYWNTPLSGVAARTLCRAAECDRPAAQTWTDILYSHFDCVNAQERFDKWDQARAITRLNEVITAEREVVVLFGRRVQFAYADMTIPSSSSVYHLDFYEWTVDSLSPTGRREVVVLSPVARLQQAYKDSAWRRVAGRILREAVSKAALMEETSL